MPEENIKKRLFIALNLPFAIKKEIACILAGFRQKYRGIKWVEEDNLHLTLHFLGYVEKEKEELVIKVMAGAEGKFKEFIFDIGEIGSFPNLRSPRVIFLNVRQVNGGSVFDLQRELGNKLADLGFTIDHRPWRAHITLGRVRDYCALGDLQGEPAKQRFSVKSFELMESKLLPTGAEYKVAASFKM